MLPLYLVYAKQHLFTQWLDAVSQQAIARKSVDEDTRCRMASRCHNELS